jgi:hypothetical protein
MLAADSESRVRVPTRFVPQPTKWQRIGNQIDSAFIASRADFVSVHLFDFRFVGYTHRRRESDDFRFELTLGIVLGHELQDTFLNKVLNGPAG